MAKITTAEAPLAATRTGGAYPWVVVALLTSVYTVAFIDRQILNLLVDPIKRTLLITDTEMSLLQGLAFSIAYIAFSPLFGRLADRANRRNILIVGVTIWSLCTIACGLSSDYWSLFLSRVGIGAAEACVTPAAWSILSDYFRRERLPRAMSFFLIAPYIGAGFAMIFGGLLINSTAGLVEGLPWLSRFEPWQLVFMVIGAPGLLIALAMLIVREPLRSRASGGVAAETFTMGQVARFFWEGRAFFFRFYLSMAFIAIALYALPAWMPASLDRRFEVDLRAVGVQYGALVAIMGTVGVLSGPLLGRWLDRRASTGSTMIVVTIAGLALIPAALAIPFAPTYGTALAAAAVATFFYSLPQAMSASALQLASPPGMRGMTASLYVFIIALIGLGVAPSIVALLTDNVFGDPAKVGMSLGIVCATSGALAAWLAWGALPHYRALLAKVEAEPGPAAGR